MLFVGCCRLQVVRCVVPVGCCLLFVACCLYVVFVWCLMRFVVVNCLSSDVFGLLAVDVFVVRCSLFVVWCLF